MNRPAPALLSRCGASLFARRRIRKSSVTCKKIVVVPASLRGVASTNHDVFASIWVVVPASLRGVASPRSATRGRAGCCGASRFAWCRIL